MRLKTMSIVELVQGAIEIFRNVNFYRSCQQVYLSISVLQYYSYYLQKQLIITSGFKKDSNNSNS